MDFDYEHYNGINVVVVKRISFLALSRKQCKQMYQKIVIKVLLNIKGNFHSSTYSVRVQRLRGQYF